MNSNNNSKTGGVSMETAEKTGRNFVNPEIIESHCHKQEKSAAVSRLNEFPRPNSKSVLDESSNDEDNQMDFSVERKMLEKAKQKKKERQLGCSR
ncbi:hypothetical protein M3Y98_00909800 [Aphelenchoides besseyi]|nr:hypothetical protein M3Y98_00909800 [Aphelenchoides besseyi]